MSPDRRRWLFRAATVFVALAVLESASWLLLWITDGTRFSPQALSDRRQALSTELPPTEVGDRAREIALKRTKTTKDFTTIHPFLGYVIDPAYPPPVSAWGVETTVATDEHGFQTYGESEEDADLRVVILGGSVALRFAAHGASTLAAELESAPALQDRRVAVDNLAMGGFKQPQQLATLAWFSALGRRPDVVVNIDGFNELALGWRNLTEGINPHYPQQWWWRVEGLPDRERQLAAGHAIYLREQRRRLAGRFSVPVLDASPTWNLVWVGLDHRLQRQLAAAEVALRRPPPDAVDTFLRSGPPYGASDMGTWIRDAAALWQRSSLEMHALCEQMGSRYYHFLQPNQYVPDSKPMGMAERRTAIDPDSTPGELVRQGYPLLAAAGEELREQGVGFHDLRMVFADVSAPLYVDTCCHVSPEGSEIMARAIARAILADLSD